MSEFEVRLDLSFNYDIEADDHVIAYQRACYRLIKELKDLMQEEKYKKKKKIEEEKKYKIFLIKK